MPDAGRYSMGEMSNMVTMPMMLAALKQINEWSPERIQEYCRKLRQPLDQYLVSNGAKFTSPEYLSQHIMRLKLPSIFDADVFDETLKEEKIFVSKRGESLRVSFNVFNENEDITSLIVALERAKQA